VSALVSLPAEPAAARRSIQPVAALFLVPITLVSLIGFIAPVANLLMLSFQKAEGTGALLGGFTLATWADVLSDDYYLSLIVDSLLTSLGITVLTLLLSYPIALYVHRCQGLWRKLLFVLVISPLLLSAVVRTYGWIAILADRGLVNRLLGAVGIPSMRLVFNLTGVIIGLTEVLMPYMILALLAGFGRLDHRAEEAALTLGATPFAVFRRVILPLSMPGIALGCMLTFVLAVSSFITPKLLGGGRVFLLATEIYDQAIVSLNWPVAAVLSGLILVIFGTALSLYMRLISSLGATAHG
jgi:putative spermidine/putrescine transport system permease protein